MKKYDETFNKLETARKTAEFLGNLYCSDTEYDKEIIYHTWKKAKVKMYELCNELNAILREENC